MADCVRSHQATHRPGIVLILLVWGRSCEKHANCGSVLEEDMVVCLQKVQVLVEGQEVTAISCFWATDDVDPCLVGFLMRHMVAHAAVAWGVPTVTISYCM